MNTQVSYLYRDADNYKAGHCTILEGTLTEEQIAQIEAKLNDYGYFIPSQVGLEDVQWKLQQYDSQDWEVDGCWHEGLNFEAVDVPPTERRTIEDLYQAFMAVGEWEEFEVEHPLGTKEEDEEDGDDLRDHTPGPQEVTPAFNDYEGHNIMGNRRYVAATHTEDAVEVTPEEASNAALIEAAPALLESLESLLSWFDRSDPQKILSMPGFVLERAQKAAKKARRKIETPA